MSSFEHSLSPKLLLTDVDDTVLQLSDVLQTFLETKGFKIDTRLRDHHNVPDLFNLEIPETIALIREFHRSPAMGELPPEPCAAVVLPQLYRQGYRFVAVSACVNEPAVHANRVRNLEQAFGFSWEAVHCLGLLQEKEDVLRSYPSGVWVEDVWNHALSGHRANHRSFLLDRPYNRHFDHSEVTRVKDWHAICRLLS